MKKRVLAILSAAILCVAAFGLAACEKDKAVVVTVGYTVAKPMNYEEDGELVGFDTELAKKTFTELGYKVVFKEIDWNKKYIELDTGGIDCVWNGFTSNSDDDGKPRAELVDFSYNYMVNMQAVVVKAVNESEYSAKESFEGKRGCAEEGSSGETYLESEFGAADIKTAAYQRDALTQVISGAADFAIVDYTLANSLAGKGDFAELRILEEYNSEGEFYAIGFKKGSDLTAKVNELLVKYGKDGSLEKLAEKYGLKYAVKTNFDDQAKEK